METQTKDGGFATRNGTRTGGFDYARLIKSKREAVREHTEAIHGLIRQTTRNVVQIGLHLQFVRNTVGRESFQAWLKAEFEWSQSTASKFMRAARVFGDLECAEQFQPTALYLLARKKTPAKAQQEAVDRARAGELITKAAAERIVRRHTRIRQRRRRDTVARVRRYVRKITEQLSEQERAELLKELTRLVEELQTDELA